MRSTWKAGSASACCGRWRWALPRRTRPVRPGAPRAVDRLDHAEQTCASTWPRSARRCSSLNFAALRIKDAVCDVAARRHRRAPQRRHPPPDLPLSLFLGPEHATLYVDTSGEALFKRGWRDARPQRRQGRSAAEGDAGRRDAGRRRLAGPGRRRPAARPLLRRRHHRHRGGADGLRHRARACSAASPSSACCPSAADAAPGARCSAPPARACMRRGAGVRRRRELSHDRLRHAQRRTGRRAQAIEFKTADACSACRRRPGTLMLNPPYGERIAPKGQGAGPRQPAKASRAAAVRPSSSRAGGALEAPLPRLDGLVPEPRHEAAVLMRLKEAAACRCGTARSNAGCSALR
jgi:hypothetical protein